MRLLVHRKQNDKSLNDIHLLTNLNLFADPIRLFATAVVATLFLTIALIERRPFVRTSACLTPLVIILIYILYANPPGDGMLFGQIGSIGLAMFFAVAASILLFLFFYQGKGRSFALFISYLVLLGVLWSRPLHWLQLVLLQERNVTDRIVMTALSAMATITCTCVPLTKRSLSRDRLLQLFLPIHNSFWRFAGVITVATIIAFLLHIGWYLTQGQLIKVHVTVPFSAFITDFLGKAIFVLLPLLSLAFVVPDILMNKVPLTTRTKLVRVFLHAALYIAVFAIMGFNVNAFVVGNALTYSWLFVVTGTAFWPFVLMLLSHVFAG